LIAFLLINIFSALSNGPVQIFPPAESPTAITHVDYLKFVRQAFTKVGESLEGDYLLTVNSKYSGRDLDITDAADKRRRILLDVVRDALFYAPSILQANSYARRNIPTYFYEVKYGLPMTDYFTVPSIINAYHETEKFMMFGYALRSQSQSQSTGARLSREVIRLWSNFAKTG